MIELSSKYISTQFPGCERTQLGIAFNEKLNSIKFKVKKLIEFIQKTQLSEILSLLFNIYMNQIFIHQTMSQNQLQFERE